MLGLCIPLAFREEKKHSGGLSRDPLADHCGRRLLQGKAKLRRDRCCPSAPAAPELLLGLRLRGVCWMRPLAWG